MFCPKVIYNLQSKQYVLWYNWLPPDVSFSNSFFGVAVSSSPAGPFKVVNPKASDTLAFGNVGDFALFVDDDEVAYIIYTAHITSSDPTKPTHQMSVERLAADYLSALGSGGNSGFFGESFVEAPTLFKRGPVYYALFGYCCCYCGGGSAVFAYQASDPLGPWTCAIAGTGGNCGQLSAGIPAQQTNVLPFLDAHGSQQFMWQGDRWQSAPDGIKGHDMTYWGHMEWNSTGNLQPLTFESKFSLDMPPP
jgi:hypothetical protein